MDQTVTEFILWIIFTVIVKIIPVLFWILVIRSIINSIRRLSSREYFKNNIVTHNDYDKYIDSNTKGKNNIYVDVSKDKLEIFNTTDINTLKDYFYDIFLKFEVAYNNLDYNIMKMISTKQLFQKYYTGITLDLKVGKKRIINNIQKKQIILYEVDSTIAKQTASVMIEISYLNYTLDHSGNVVSGYRDKPIVEKFEVTFRKDFERQEIVKCPNCGASIVGNRCDFCRTTLKNVDFKISSIKRIVD